MKANSLGVRELLLPTMALSLLLIHACAAIGSGAKSPPNSFQSAGKLDLSGVWTGTSIVGCSPLRMSGPRHCGARSNIMITIIEERADAISGFYASDSGLLQQNGRVIGMPAPSTRLWLRVMMNDHSSCIFSSELPGDAMRGPYLCFHDGASLERGYWAARRTY